MLWLQYIYWHTRPLPGVFEKTFSELWRDSLCVEWYTQQLKLKPRSFLWNELCNRKENSCNLCAGECCWTESTVASVLMYVWWQAWWLQYAGLILCHGEKWLKEIQYTGLSDLFYTRFRSFHALDEERRWGEKTECQLFIFIVSNMFMINEGLITDIKAV